MDDKLKTKISLLHRYAHEIAQLNKKLAEIGNLKKTIELELIEAFPFTKDDIIFINNYITKIDNVETAFLNSDSELSFFVKVFPQSSFSGFNTNTSSMVIKLSDISKFKKLN